MDDDDEEGDLVVQSQSLGKHSRQQRTVLTSLEEGFEAGSDDSQASSPKQQPATETDMPVAAVLSPAATEGSVQPEPVHLAREMQPADLSGQDASQPPQPTELSNSAASGSPLVAVSMEHITVTADAARAETPPPDAEAATDIIKLAAEEQTLKDRLAAQQQSIFELESAGASAGSSDSKDGADAAAMGGVVPDQEEPESGSPVSSSGGSAAGVSGPLEAGSEDGSGNNSQQERLPQHSTPKFELPSRLLAEFAALHTPVRLLGDQQRAVTVTLPSPEASEANAWDSPDGAPEPDDSPELASPPPHSPSLPSPASEAAPASIVRCLAPEEATGIAALSDQDETFENEVSFPVQTFNIFEAIPSCCKHASGHHLHSDSILFSISGSEHDVGRIAQLKSHCRMRF